MLETLILTDNIKIQKEKLFKLFCSFIIIVSKYHLSILIQNICVCQKEYLRNYENLVNFSFIAVFSAIPYTNFVSGKLLQIQVSNIMWNILFEFYEIII